MPDATGGGEDGAPLACGKCHKAIKRVDLHGAPFFAHKPRRDCLTWWHVDSFRDYSHQAVPGSSDPSEGS